MCLAMLVNIIFRFSTIVQGNNLAFENAIFETKLTSNPKYYIQVTDAM